MKLPDALRRGLFWTCLPIVIPQAILLRKRAPRLGPAQGPFRGNIGKGRKTVTLWGVGDSIIAGVGVAAADQALTARVAAGLAEIRDLTVIWQAAGCNGLTAGEIRRQMVPRLPKAPADIILISTGVNDVTHLQRTRSWIRNLTGLMEDLRFHSPEALLVMAGVPPLHAFPLLPQPLRRIMGMRAKWFDGLAQTLVESRSNSLYVPLRFNPRPDKFSADGYHPSSETYFEIGRLIARAILAGIATD